MGRPTKQGIDYFPLDTTLSDDMALFVAEVGADGYGILITIWQMIYSGHGYFIENDEKLSAKVKMRCFSDTEKVASVVENAISSGIFSDSASKNHKILTSRGIQKRYLVASRKKKKVEMNHDFLLIDVSDAENVVFPSDNSISGSKNATKEKKEGKEEGETPSPTTKKHTIPSNFVVNEQMNNWATEKGMSERVKVETEKFINYAKANNRKQIDWEYAWRNWMLKSLEYKPAQKNMFAGAK